MWLLAFYRADWLNFVEFALPVAQVVTALVLIGLLVVAGIRVGWKERARPQNL